MKTLAAVALALTFATSIAAQANRTLTVGVHDTFVMQVFGATAAYAVDPAIAEAAVFNGTVTIYGRGAGKTQVIVVSITGQTPFDVTVQGSAGSAATQTTQQRDQSGARVETRYSSARREVQNTVDIVAETPKKRTEIHVENVNYGQKTSTRATATVPSVSYRVFTRHRELTLLDRVVDHSPLTISTATVRGIHYLDDHWRIHAGYTAYAAYQSFLLPTQRDTVLGVAYSVPLSAHTRLTPGVFAYPSIGDSVASLLFDYARDEKTNARAELGLSNGAIGGAAELALDRDHHRLRLDVRYRPRDFASVTPGQPRGLFADGISSATFGRTSIDTSVSVSDFDLPGLQQRTISAATNGRVRVTDSLSLLGGVSYGAFDKTRSLIVPAGAQLDFRHFGLTALYRWSENSATNRGGGGFRLAARASAGRFFATAYVDRQKQAPTLAVIFREQPDLALALEQLGITATTPGDIARALRENSALIALGYIDGVTVDLAPARTQGGVEFAWMGTGAARPQLRARVLFNRTETVASETQTIIATLTGSRRITEATDLFASYTWWLTKRQGQDEVVQPIVEVGIRHRFDDLPSFGARGTIAGSVFIDENLDGAPDGGGVADAEIEVDGARTKTAADGSFAVLGITRGAHRVTARVPNVEGAYFTTPSRVEASSGDVVRFGVALTPARVFGRIISDAGDGIGGVTVALTRGMSRFSAITGSEGSYSIAAPPGEWSIAVDATTLPAGFSGDDARAVRLDRAAPTSVAWKIRANRSITGHAPAGATSVFLDRLGRSVPVAPDGSFSIRSLPAGEITLRVRDGKRELSTRVTLPREPGVVAGVIFH
jgi:hypothetical protein